jgi:hypothetical protein
MYRGNQSPRAMSIRPSGNQAASCAERNYCADFGRPRKGDTVHFIAATGRAAERIRMGTPEAVQQLLLIVIPALILVLIHPGSAKER